MAIQLEEGLEITNRRLLELERCGQRSDRFLRGASNLARRVHELRYDLARDGLGAIRTSDGNRIDRRSVMEQTQKSGSRGCN